MATTTVNLPLCPLCDAVPTDLVTNAHKARSCPACRSREAGQLGDVLARSCAKPNLTPEQRAILAAAATVCYEERDRAGDDSFQAWLGRIQDTASGPTPVKPRVDAPAARGEQ